eukprot:g6196.t1
MSSSVNEDENTKATKFSFVSFYKSVEFALHSFHSDLNISGNSSPFPRAVRIECFLNSSALDVKDFMNDGGDGETAKNECFQKCHFLGKLATDSLCCVDVFLLKNFAEDCSSDDFVTLDFLDSLATLAGGHIYVLPDSEEIFSNVLSHHFQRFQKLESASDCLLRLRTGIGFQVSNCYGPGVPTSTSNSGILASDGGALKVPLVSPWTNFLFEFTFTDSIGFELDDSSSSSAIMQVAFGYTDGRSGERRIRISTFHCNVTKSVKRLYLESNVDTIMHLMVTKLVRAPLNVFVDPDALLLWLCNENNYEKQQLLLNWLSQFILCYKKANHLQMIDEDSFKGNQLLGNFLRIVHGICETVFIESYNNCYNNPFGLFLSSFLFEFSPEECTDLFYRFESEEKTSKFELFINKFMSH